MKSTRLDALAAVEPYRSTRFDLIERQDGAPKHRVNAWRRSRRKGMETANAAGGVR